MLTGLRLASRPLLISPLVVAEVSYMIGRDGGSPAEAAFISSIRNGDLTLVELIPADLDRMVELLNIYKDLLLGATDASVVALAERLNVTDIATLDQRHFTVVRPNHVAAFTLLPYGPDSLIWPHPDGAESSERRNTWTWVLGCRSTD